MASSKIKLTSDEKAKFMALIKSVDIKELVIPDEAHQKWFKFGAYDALRILSEDVLTSEEPRKNG